MLLCLLCGGLWLNAAIWLARGARLRRRVALAPDADAALRLGGCAGADAAAEAPPPAGSFAPQLAAPAADAPELCFVVRVMPSHLPNLPALVFSAAGSSGALRVRFIFVRTYAPPPGGGDGLDAAVAFLNAALQPLRASGGEPPASVAPIDGSFTEAHFPGLRDASYAGDAGYVVTDVVLESVLARRAAAAGGGGFCDALVVTNGDNLYTSGFVPAVAAALREGSELVGVHFVSRYNYTAKVRDGNWRSGHGPLRLGADVEYSPRFVPYGIDLGAVAFTADLLKRGGTLFALDRLRADPSGRGVDFISADGRFFEALQAEAAAPTIIPRVLYVHQ